MYLGWKLKGLAVATPAVRVTGKGCSKGSSRIEESTDNDEHDDMSCKPRGRQGHHRHALKERKTTSQSHDGKLVYVTADGEYYHSKRDCRGLTKAVSTVERRPCRFCVGECRG